MKYNVKTEQGTGTPEKSALKVRVYEEETEPIGTDGIADGAVTSAKIADGAVTAGKLAEGAIPTASASTLGGVKVGDGLSIDNTGVLSADGGVVTMILQETSTNVFVEPAPLSSIEILNYLQNGIPVFAYVLDANNVWYQFIPPYNIYNINDVNNLKAAFTYRSNLVIIDKDKNITVEN